MFPPEEESRPNWNVTENVSNFALSSFYNRDALLLGSSCATSQQPCFSLAWFLLAALGAGASRDLFRVRSPRLTSHLPVAHVASLARHYTPGSCIFHCFSVSPFTRYGFHNCYVGPHLPTHLSRRISPAAAVVAISFVLPRLGY